MLGELSASDQKIIGADDVVTDVQILTYGGDRLSGRDEERRQGKSASGR